mgnify:CR=1 FL=1|tara:strand:+ start:61 stop:2082 length:2022 start_codon:yes stop_codon:yes gene_type:complete
MANLDLQSNPIQLDGLLAKIVEYMKDPNRTQQMQGLGGSVEKGLLNLFESDKAFDQNWQQAFADPKNPLQLTDAKALSKLTEMMMNGPMGMAPVGMAKVINKPAAQGLLDATAEQRTGVGKSKERVGTTGQYVGAPSGVNTPQKLQDINQAYIEDVLQGTPGRNWYGDSSNWINQVAPEKRSQAIADAIGVSSQGTGVDSNLGFAVKGINQFAQGSPVKTGRFPGNQSPLIEKALAGEQQHLGPKRQPFASNLSVAWNPEMANTPVHDIWQGRAFGYKTAKGKPWDAGFSPQQHSFMDDQMKVVQQQLNSQKAGGFNNWDPLNTQASAWTGAKIRAGDLLPEEAAMHYGNFSPKYQAMATHEQAPGAGTGHLENLLSAPFEERLAYQNFAPWVDSRGRDKLYGAGGLLTEPSTTMVGAYTPKGTGLLEINPGEVARPLVQQAGGKVLPGNAQMLDMVESSRAYVDAQNAGAWHKIIPDSQSKPGDRNSLHIPMESSPSPKQMKKLATLAEQNGMFAVDTGKGVNLINDPYSKIGAKRTGKQFQQDVRTDFGQQVTSITGQPGRPVKIETGYQDYESAWKDVGSGKATKQFLESLKQNEHFANNIEPALQEKALANFQRDAKIAKSSGGKVREDIQRARKILATKGIVGLTAALASGVVLADSARSVLDPQQLD